MNNKKGLKYYSIIFLFSVIAVGIYLVVNTIQGTELETTYVVSILVIPFFFTVLLFSFDKVIELLLPKKKKTVADEYQAFILASTELLKNDDSIQIEDFKKLRESEKFQRALKQIYNIRTNGETEDSNYKIVKKRFKKDTLEYNAVMKIIE